MTDRLRQELHMLERLGAVMAGVLVAVGCAAPTVVKAAATRPLKAPLARIASPSPSPVVAEGAVPASVKYKLPDSCYGQRSHVEMLANQPYAAVEIPEGMESAGARRCKLATRKVRRDELTEVRCFGGMAGEEAVWGVVVQNPTAYGERPRWQLFYQTDATGVKSDWNESAGGMPGAATPVAVFDLDADGRSEVVTVVRAFTDAGASAYYTVEVWSAGKKAVESLPAVAGHQLIDVRDVNEDGRPEFLEDPYRVQMGSRLSAMHESQVEWSSLLEITGRTTTKSDGEMARTFAREICPSGEGILSFLADVPEYCVAHVVHCAAVWGVPAAETQAALERYCTGERAQASDWCEESLNSWKHIAQGRALLP